jgi:hypothetical protein
MFDSQSDSDGDPPSPEAAIGIIHGLELEVFK